MSIEYTKIWKKDRNELEKLRQGQEEAKHEREQQKNQNAKGQSKHQSKTLRKRKVQLDETADFSRNVDHTLDRFQVNKTLFVFQIF